MQVTNTALNRRSRATPIWQHSRIAGFVWLQCQRSQERAAAAGYRTVGSLDYTPEEIDAHLGGLFSRYLEFTLDTARRCGFTVTLAQIDAKPND
ncbi:hypothetical protein [Rhodococcus sp. UFZ-B548]|uniref:hypothetical protein n=1 Tax=Rhodococcus sp. UFZ-B548 TaxID=2742212 RepID=UPI0015F66123|nr:hypothetical protein [Rhodococcus sp. UFZ-B548]